MDPAPDQEVAHHLPGHRVVGHLVNPQLGHAGADLEEEVVEQVQDQVPAGEDVITVPVPAHGVAHQSRLPGVDEVVDVPHILDHLQRGVLGRGRLGAAGEEQVDGGGHQLDVAQLLGGNVGDEVV